MKHTKLIRIVVIDSHCCPVELYSFPSGFKLLNFNTVEITDHVDYADYGDVSDEFSDITEDTDDEYRVNMQDKHQTFVDCLSIITDSRYKLIDDIQPSFKCTLLHWEYR